ncbi:hemerythrin family protein [Pelagibius sp. CAU 1746]|uniref:hemerythrin family protein n=1 Tax=Pelagibius sp. CAU 1746 TaxID=3140370 RepID=UPI00325A718A
MTDTGDGGARARESVAKCLDLILDDHFELRELLDDLSKAVAAGDTAFAKQVLLRFQVWMERHFAIEEDAMRSFGFPDYEAHRGHHESLRDSLAAIDRFLLLDEPGALHDGVVDYVEQTLTHVEELDRPLDAFLRAAMP